MVLAVSVTTLASPVTFVPSSSFTSVVTKVGRDGGVAAGLTSGVSLRLLRLAEHHIDAFRQISTIRIRKNDGMGHAAAWTGFDLLWLAYVQLQPGQWRVY